MIAIARNDTVVLSAYIYVTNVQTLEILNYNERGKTYTSNTSLLMYGNDQLSLKSTIQTNYTLRTKVRYRNYVLNVDRHTAYAQKQNNQQQDSGPYCPNDIPRLGHAHNEVVRSCFVDNEEKKALTLDGQ